MRRDIAFFIPADVPSVYNAYLSALGNDKFRRECAQEPYHTLTFGLNFSAKFLYFSFCFINFFLYFLWKLSCWPGVLTHFFK